MHECVLRWLGTIAQEGWTSCHLRLTWETVNSSRMSDRGTNTHVYTLAHSRYTHAQAHLLTSTHSQAHMFTHMQACMNSHTCMHAHMLTHTQSHTHRHAHTHTHAHRLVRDSCVCTNDTVVDVIMRCSLTLTGDATETYSAFYTGNSDELQNTKHGLFVRMWHEQSSDLLSLIKFNNYGVWKVFILFFRYSITRLNEYFRRKKEFFALTLP